MDLVTMIAVVVIFALGIAIGYFAARRRGDVTDPQLAQKLAEAQSRCMQLEGLQAASREGSDRLHAEVEGLRKIVREQEKSIGGFEQMKGEYESIRAEVVELRKRESDSDKVEIALRKEKEALERTKKELDEAIAQMHAKSKLEFESLANKILEEKSVKHSRDSQEKIDNLLKPLGERILVFQKDVAERFSKETTEKALLKEHIGQLMTAQGRLSQEAQNLTEALRGSAKAQGNWGEITLENILESSGLVKDRDYIREAKGLSLISNAGDEASRVRPDVIVKLPDGKCLIVDSKVTIGSYERYIAAKGDEEKDQCRREYVAALRTHFAGLSSKQYQNLEGLDSPEFVFMFLPTEGAFSFAMEADVQMFRDAWEKNIIIVSPTNLLATLRTVASVWRIVRQEQEAANIARVGGLLYDQFVQFVDELKKVGSAIEGSKQAYDKAFKRLCQGRRDNNIVRQAEKLRELGAKTQMALPDDLVERAESTGDGESAVVGA